MQKRVTKLKRIRKNDWSPQRVAEYSSIINTRRNNFMAMPKVLLSLSAGGIGLLIGVSNSFSFSSIWQMLAFSGGILGFLMTIFFIFGMYGCKYDIFDAEKELIIRGTEPKDLLTKKDKVYKKHKWFSGWIAGLFMFAVLSTAVFGVISIYEKYDAQYNRYK
jgi:hypothetical protein